MKIENNNKQVQNKKDNKMTNQQAKTLCKQYNASGRIAFLHPRKKYILFDGFIRLSYTDAAKRVSTILERDKQNSSRNQ